MVLDASFTSSYSYPGISSEKMSLIRPTFLEKLHGTPLEGSTLRLPTSATALSGTVDPYGVYRVVSTEDTLFTFVTQGVDAQVTVSGVLLPANNPEVFHVGDKDGISVLQEATPGLVFVTRLA